MEWMNIVYVLYHIVCLLTSYAVETDQVTLRASAFDTGVTGWYQSFDCSEPGFLLESSLQSLGSSHETDLQNAWFSLHTQSTRSTTQNVFQK
ncbi:hypothetical protein HanPI659440_Chr00c09g0721501 [Helianthus annuus]|nr:hypothetical protein HanPI659440_Chr00c09g0721501 [Helianthus annuus]